MLLFTQSARIHTPKADDEKRNSASRKGCLGCAFQGEGLDVCCSCTRNKYAYINPRYDNYKETRY